MHDKQKILDSLFPQAVLKAMTEEARASLPAPFQASGMVCILASPFRVGRESRVLMINDKPHRVERPAMPGSVPSNELYLMDAGRLLQVSREHFSIDKTADGFALTDRGSKCGLSVAGKRLGIGAGVMTAPLHDGDLITIGTAESHYRFSFIAGFDHSHW